MTEQEHSDEDARARERTPRALRIRYLDPEHPDWAHHAVWCECWTCMDVDTGDR